MNLKLKVTLTLAFAACIGLTVASSPSMAQQGQAKKPEAKPAAAAGPVELGKFGDWGAYAVQTARGKVCYALSEPKERKPAGLKRDPGYLFVSFRPSENVRNEINVRFGFPPADKSDATVQISTGSWKFYTQNEGAWIRNAAEEAQVIDSMKRGTSFSVKATSKRGNEVSDLYSLTGFSGALDRATKECQP
jgi:hypothetical protein